MSSGMLIDLKDSARNYQEEILSKDDSFKFIRGPHKISSLIEPIEYRDNTVKDPTLISYVKPEHLSPQTGALSDQRRKSRLVQVPSQFQVQFEDQKKEEPNSKLDTFGQTTKTPPTQGINLLRVIMAKSYFNRFVENLLRKTYVRKPYQFNKFVSTLIDDLIYYYRKGKYEKSRLAELCQYLKFLPVFDQSSLLVIGWQILHILTILVILFWTPFIIGFGITYEQHVLSNITVKNVEIYFLISIIVDFVVVTNTTFIDRGTIIRSRKKIVTNYIKSQAIYDLFAFVSLLIALQFTIDNADEKIEWQLLPYSIFYLVRLFKLQVRIRKLEEFFAFTGWTQDLIELLKLFFTVIYIGHLFACIWHAVAFYNKDNLSTWIEQKELQNADNFTRFNYSFYWAVQTMITVGYGDISPQNNIERVFVNVSMFLACGVFAFSFNSIGMMLSNLNSKSDIYKRSTNLLNQFLTKNQIKTDLKSRIRNYYDYIFQEEQEINDEEVQVITNKLSNHLQEELKYEIRMNIIKMAKVLNRFSTRALRNLSLQVEEVRFSPEDFILQQNTQDDCSLYIITKGKVQILFQDDREDRNTRILGVMGKGQCFGEYGFFTGLHRTASVRSCGFSRAYKIARSQFLSIINQNDLQKFCEIKDNILLYLNNQPAQIRCFACDKFDHLIKDCPVVHYIPDKERIIKKELYPVQQQRDKTFKRAKTDRQYYPTLSRMKMTKAIILELQTLQNNVTIIEDVESLGSYAEEEYDDQQYSYLSKSQSKLSRQQSQKNSVSHEHTLQPIQESEGSSSEVNSPKKPRAPVVKQTLNTAGFGGQDSFGNRFQMSHQESEIEQHHQQTAFQILPNPTREDDHKFSLKYQESVKGHQEGVKLHQDSIRVIQKKGTIQRQKKKEESYRAQSQTLLALDQQRERSNSNIKKYAESNMSNEKEKEKKKKMTTQKSRTIRTHRSVKLDQSGSYQINQIVIPVYDPPISMELDQFESGKCFRYYFQLNNFSEIIKRANRVLSMLLMKKKVGSEFSLYTFSFYAKNKALKMRKKLKQTFEEINPQIENLPKKVTKASLAHRRASKRVTQQDDPISGLFKRKALGPSTQIQVNSQLVNRFQRDSN